MVNWTVKGGLLKRDTEKFGDGVPKNGTATTPSSISSSIPFNVTLPHVSEWSPAYWRMRWWVFQTVLGIQLPISQTLALGS